MPWPVMPCFARPRSAALPCEPCPPVALPACARAEPSPHIRARCCVRARRSTKTIASCKRSASRSPRRSRTTCSSGGLRERSRRSSARAPHSALSPGSSASKSCTTAPPHVRARLYRRADRTPRAGHARGAPTLLALEPFRPACAPPRPKAQLTPCLTFPHIRRCPACSLRGCAGAERPEQGARSELARSHESTRAALVAHQRMETATLRAMAVWYRQRGEADPNASASHY